MVLYCKKKDGNDDDDDDDDDDDIDVSKRAGCCQSLCTPCIIDDNVNAIGALLTFF